MASPTKTTTTRRKNRDARLLRKRQARLRRERAKLAKAA